MYSRNDEVRFQLDNACRNLGNVLNDELAVERKEKEYADIISARKDYDVWWANKMRKRLNEQQAIRKNLRLHRAYIG